MQEHHTADSGFSSLPTPKARDSQAEGYDAGLRRATPQVGTIVKALVDGDERVLMPTPMTSDARHNNNEGSWNRKSPQIGTIVHTTNWGKFEPAIKRWEEVLGRPAPAPTKADGKDGAHRLSSAFTEWMMGLEPGWITDCGLSRNDELKACGNGVVPQQAELALRVLLEGITLPRGGGQVNLPTPTVSDTFTDNLASTQQKEGSMHSVTLPQAVKWVTNEH